MDTKVNTKKVLLALLDGITKGGLAVCIIAICTCTTARLCSQENIFNEEEAICFLDIHRHNDMEEEQGFFIIITINEKA